MICLSYFIELYNLLVSNKFIYYKVSKLNIDLQSKYKEPTLSTESMASDPNLVEKQQEEAELAAYLEATGGVSKNRIVGIPRVPAYVLVPPKNSRAHSHAASSSGSGPHVDGVLLQNMVHGVLKSLHTQSLKSLSPTQVNIAEQETIYGSTNSENSVPMDIQLAVHRSLALFLEGALKSGAIQVNIFYSIIDIKLMLRFLWFNFYWVRDSLLYESDIF